MPKKALIFIDGQNLFYSLKNMGIQENEINWDAFFKALIENDDELVRVYWYQPQKLSGPALKLENAKRHVEDQSSKTPQAINTEAQSMLATAKTWTTDRNSKYERQLHRYDEMSIRFPIIEMVRKGILKINSFKQIYVGEKGLDVALAVNMIKFHDKCDKIILVSGDLDYAEAIQFIKDNLKVVHIARLFQGSPPVNRSVSRTLMAIADKVIDIYESDIKANYFL